jgi:hypothetical protein
MKKIIQTGGVVALVFALVQTVSAVPATGNIGFTGGATINSSSVGTATEVTGWISPVVTLDAGSFAGIALGTSVSISSPWSFNSGAISSFWTVGGFTFNLMSSMIASQGTTPAGYVVVDGTGTVSGNGLGPTTMVWNFTSQDPKAGTNPDSWTFGARADTNVPDGGATVMLLGISLSGLTLLRKRFLA